ncbi:MAG TPA: carboxypeptidase regulatory-like domain-containing protein [Polyangia bacterium]|nr:carboxypeptidase regulatory-like domain-containing protein [Polyangia bacterium]
MIKRAVAIFAVAASVTAAACQKESAAPTPAAAPAAPAAAAPAATAPAPSGHGVIDGTVKLNGTPPQMAPTKRDADPFCAKTPMKDEEVVVGPGGGLGNVVVRVTEGAGGHYDPPATPATLDQSNCMYRPRVQAIVNGQPLSIRNSDQTLHNVHGYKGPSTLFNQAEIPGLPPMARKVGEAGDVLKFKCDVHPWMTGYVVVSANPYFAVTGPDGHFKITGLPPGKYTLTAWQERYGTQTAPVTVAEDKPAEVSFAYDAK